MKRINKALSLMLTAALSCVVLTGNALAADGDRCGPICARLPVKSPP